MPIAPATNAEQPKDSAADGRWDGHTLRSRIAYSSLKLSVRSEYLVKPITEAEHVCTCGSSAALLSQSEGRQTRSLCYPPTEHRASGQVVSVAIKAAAGSGENAIAQCALHFINIPQKLIFLDRPAAEGESRRASGRCLVLVGCMLLCLATVLRWRSRPRDR